MSRQSQVDQTQVARPTAVSVALAAIKLDGGTQPRAAIFEQTVNDYVAALTQGDEFPPVVLYFDGVDYWLADGFHRYYAAVGMGWAEFPAEVRQGTRRDAVLYSVGANSTHGRQRTQEDKRRAIMVLLNDPEWTQWSDREIARRCRVDGKTVASLRPRQTAEICSEPDQRRYTTRHGTTAVMNTAPIGRRADQAPAKVEAPAPSPVNLATATAELLADNEANGFIASNIWRIEELVEELPAPAEAVRRFPQMLLHDFSTARAKAVAAYFERLSKEWAAQHGGVRVAAE